MKFLKNKFSDIQNCIDLFLGENNELRCLENDEEINTGIKKIFVNSFTKSLVKERVISKEVLNTVSDSNAWSIDFPSWHGSFDEKIGKDFFIIGSEPHIHNKYLQTVYGLNNYVTSSEYLSSHHPIFHFVSELLADKFMLSKIETLDRVYLTDLFPLSPLRGKGLSVGSSDKIQSVIGETGNWGDIRLAYAAKHLQVEIESVNPKLIITQGKNVFNEVLSILNIKESHSNIKITPKKGKSQYVRFVNWNEIKIVSVPHIGSNRMRTFWNNNLALVKEAFMKL